jgi:Spy/CpxP family protein refolding chaperone
MCAAALMETRRERAALQLLTCGFPFKLIGFRHRLRKEHGFMKKLCLIIAVVWLATSPINSAAFDDRAGFGPPPDKGPVMHHGKGPGMEMPPQLNLTAEQKSKLHDLRLEFLKASKPVMDRIISKRGDYHLLWMEKDPDAGKIMAVQKEIFGLESAFFELELKHRFAVLKILTQDQQEAVRMQFSGQPAFPPPPRGRVEPPPVLFHPPCHGAF